MGRSARESPCSGWSIVTRSRDTTTRSSRLLPFWQLTSEQDWSLCEQNQRGVSNPAFVPGPYSSEREYNVLAFVQWYLERMTERCDRPSTSGRAR